LTTVSLLGPPARSARRPRRHRGRGARSFRRHRTRRVRESPSTNWSSRSIRAPLAAVCSTRMRRPSCNAVARTSRFSRGARARGKLATRADVALNAVVGFAGLPVRNGRAASRKAVGAGQQGSLIAGGPVVQRVRATPGAELVPTDSENSATIQCLHSAVAGEHGVGATTAAHRERRTVPRRTLDESRPSRDEALRPPPTWRMGPKVTIDSPRW